MAITSGDGYIAASKQVVPWSKTASVTTIATTRHTTRGAAGIPGAGTLAFGSAVPGQVLNDTNSGFPTLNAFGVGNTGYLTRVQWNNSVVGRVELWDMLYSVNIPTGASGFGTLQTLTVTAPASYLGRCPDGAGHGLRIFVEITTTMSASATTVTATYTNSGGTSGRTTASSGSLSGFTASRWVELALQAGDSGVQKLESIIIGGATNAAGIANVIVARRLWTNSTRVANAGTSEGIDMTGMPIVYETSALCVTTVADSTASGLVDMDIEITNG